MIAHILSIIALPAYGIVSCLLGYWLRGQEEKGWTQEMSEAYRKAGGDDYAEHRSRTEEKRK